MEAKYVATIDFTSLQQLKMFIGIVNQAGGSFLINGGKPDLSTMVNNPILAPDFRSENSFTSEIKIYASTTIDLERAKEVLNCEIGDKVKKSASCTLLESVSNFKGIASRTQ